VQSKLGSGKFSVVYEGIDKLNKKKVIVKVLKQDNQDKIKREIMALNLLKDKSANILNLIEYGIKGSVGSSILVMKPIIFNFIDIPFPLIK
jgi:serine/threonine protein kinase